MHGRLTALAASIRKRAENEPFFTLSEGLIKVRAIEAALDLGWTLQEGAPAPGSAFTIRKHLDVVTITRDVRKLSVPDGSADMYVVDPFDMMLEIKARPDVGSKAHAQFDQVMLDVGRVASTPKMALLFVFDRDIYSSFSGERTSAKGRPSEHKGWFNQAFPKYSEVVALEEVRRLVHAPQGPLDLLFSSVASPLGGRRIVVAGTRPDSDF